MPNSAVLSEARLITLCEIVVVALLAVQLALLGWRLVQPQGPVGQPVLAYPVASAALSERFDPFAGAVPATAPGSGAGSTWKLFGTRVDGEGGSAILGRGDDRQAAWRAGETIAPGWVLERVATDHVLLRGGGGMQRVDVLQPAAATARVMASSAPVAAAVTSDATQVLAPASPDAAGIDLAAVRALAVAGLQPRQRDGQVAGYTLGAAASMPLLRQAGLQPGDVLLGVDGMALDAGRLQALVQGGDAPRQATLSFERDGQVHRVVLENPQP